MVTKPTKEFTDSYGRRKIKGNMDIELAVDVIEMADKLDHVVIFSGDGDFRRLVESVQRKGVRVSIVSTVRSQPPMAADELRRQADVFIELQDLAPQISRDVQHREARYHHDNVDDDEPLDDDMPDGIPEDADLEDAEDYDDPDDGPMPATNEG